jgi:hypothetical protein
MSFAVEVVYKLVSLMRNANAANVIRFNEVYLSDHLKYCRFFSSRRTCLKRRLLFVGHAIYLLFCKKKDREFTMNMPLKPETRNQCQKIS